MGPPFLLLPQLLPVEEVRLPSLIPSLQAPDQGAFPSRSGRATEWGDDIAVTSLLSVEAFSREHTSTTLSAAFTKLLTTHFGPEKEDSLHISSKLVKEYRLRDQKTAFRRLCGSDDGKAWLEDGIQSGEKSYLLVGAVTVSDASISQVQSHARHVGAEISAPVGTVLGHGMDPFAGVLDHGLGLRGAQGGAETFRILRRRRTAATAALDDTVRWTPLSRQRAQSEDDEGLEVSNEDLDSVDEEDEFGYEREGDFLVAA